MHKQNHKKHNKWTNFWPMIEMLIDTPLHVDPRDNDKDDSNQTNT